MSRCRHASSRRTTTTVRAAARGSKTTTSGNKGGVKKRLNYIEYKPDPNAPKPWYPINETTGKPPGWFQLLVFAGSQLFIGVVMQPAALVYQSLFDPFLTK